MFCKGLRTIKDKKDPYRSLGNNRAIVLEVGRACQLRCLMWHRRPQLSPRNPILDLAGWGCGCEHGSQRGMFVGCGSGAHRARHGWLSSHQGRDWFLPSYHWDLRMWSRNSVVRLRTAWWHRRSHGVPDVKTMPTRSHRNQARYWLTSMELGSWRRPFLADVMHFLSSVLGPLFYRLIRISFVSNRNVSLVLSVMSSHRLMGRWASKVTGESSYKGIVWGGGFYSPPFSFLGRILLEMKNCSCAGKCRYWNWRLK